MNLAARGRNTPNQTPHGPITPREEVPVVTALLSQTATSSECSMGEHTDDRETAKPISGPQEQTDHDMQQSIADALPTKVDGHELGETGPELRLEPGAEDRAEPKRWWRVLA